MAKIYSPNEQYTGVSASVPFINGVGQCSDPALLEWFEQHDYTVEHEEENDHDEELQELRLKGKELGIPSAGRMGKTKLLELIAQKEAETEDPKAGAEDDN